MYRLEAENFCLELHPTVYEDDLPFPVNTSLQIRVASCGFTAEVVMELDVGALADFAADLNKLYKTLTGSAKLEEPYGVHSYIEFVAGDRGHIGVKGRLHNGNAYGYEQELTFENELDQTYLKDFARALAATYGR